MKIRSLHLLHLYKSLLTVGLIASLSRNTEDVCMTMYFLLGGSTKSYGILYVEFLQHFRSGSGSTAWMPSIFYLITFGLGPFSNYFGEKVSFRVACLVGSVVLSVGYVCSAFVTRMEHMYITYGIICGFGYGTCFSPFTTIANYYFEKRRSLANGIMAASSGAGAFVFPLLYRYLIDHYGLQGALWIIGGIILHACPAACLLRQPEMFTKQDSDKLIRDADKSIASDNSDRQSENCSLQSVNTSIQSNCLNDTGQARHCYIRKEEINIREQKIRKNSDKTTAKIYTNERIHNKETDGISPNDTDCGAQKTTSPSQSTTDHPKLSSCSRESDNVESHLCAIESGRQNETELEILDWQSKIIDKNENSRRSNERLHKDETVCSRGPNLRWRLFTRPEFVILAVSFWLFMIGLVCNVVVFPAHVVQVGLSDEDASVCVSILGVSDVIARVGLGWFADRKIVDLKWMFVVHMMVGGVFGIILPYFKSFAFMAIYSVIVGVIIGSFWSLFPAMLVAAIGLKDFAAGYGLLMMGTGVLIAAFLPFIGWLEDVTGSWDTSFRVLGTILLLASMTQAFDTWIQRLVLSCTRRALQPRVDGLVLQGRKC